MTLHGPGGSSRGIGSGVTQPLGGQNAGTGTPTTVTGANISPTLSAGAGAPGNSFSGGQSTVGGNGGTASGGDTNTGGSGGTGGVTLGTTGQTGFGGGSPGGGAGTGGWQYGPATKGQGDTANAPGGGAGGSAAGQFGANTVRHSAGGGGGARVIKTFGASVLMQGVPITVIVGDSGAAGLAGQSPQDVAGRKGAPGSFRIEQ